MRSRRRRGELEAIGPLVTRTLQDLGADDALRVMRVVERWEEAVGAEIARHCQPTALRGAVLEASVDSSAWCQQLKLRTPEILSGLERVLGDEAPSELWLRVG
jgi:predicted nucleic acid-binding Zn ribbon protein